MILSEKQKKELIKPIGECELCGGMDSLQLHRIKRGNQKGTYELRNVMCLCEDCHKNIHANEFKSCSR